MKQDKATTSIPVQVGMKVKHSLINKLLTVAPDEKGPAYTGNEFADDEISLSHAIQEYKMGNLTIPVNDENLKKLADLLEDRGVRKYLNINGFGYSQIERDIVELFQPPAQPIPVNDELDIKHLPLSIHKTDKLSWPFEIYSAKNIKVASIPWGIGSNMPETIEEVKTNAKAICTAVNETYGKGYNPAAMEELYKALDKAVGYLADLNGSNWITGEDAGSLDMKQRAKGLQSILYTTLHNAKTIKK